MGVLFADRRYVDYDGAAEQAVHGVSLGLFEVLCGDGISRVSVGRDVAVALAAGRSC